MLDEREDWHTVDETTGLSKYDQLVDAAEDFEALGTEFSSAIERNLAYARRVWPDLDGDALERKASLVGRQMTTILDRAHEKKLQTRNPMASLYLPVMDLLATAPADVSDSFHGAPRLLQYLMYPMIVATLSLYLKCYAQAERAAKHFSRGQANGQQGIYRMIFRWIGLGAIGAPLFLLKIALEACGLKPYVGPTIRFALCQGVPLGLIYALNSMTFQTCGICAIALALAGCLFGKKKQVSAVDGGEAKKGRGEASVLDKRITIPSRHQVKAIARAANCLTPGDGFRGALRVQKAPMLAPPRFDPSGANQGDGTDAYFYFGGKTPAALKASFEVCYERDIKFWANGREGTGGHARWDMLRIADAGVMGHGSFVGYDFQLFINNDQGLYTPSGPYGGVQLSNGWVERIGCPLERDPLLIELCRRANDIQFACLDGREYDPRTAPLGHGGPAKYGDALPEPARSAARRERGHIQSFGDMVFAARRLYNRHALPVLMAAIARVDQAAVEAAIADGDRDLVIELLTPVGNAIKQGVARVGAALEAGRKIGVDWRTVADDAAAELKRVCAPRLARLPTDEVQRAVVLSTLEGDAMKDAGWWGRRPVPDASGFRDAPAVGPPAPLAPAYGNSGNARPRARRRRDDVDPTEEAKADTAGLFHFADIDIEDIATGYY